MAADRSDKTRKKGGGVQIEEDDSRRKRRKRREEGKYRGEVDALTENGVKNRHNDSRYKGTKERLLIWTETLYHCLFHLHWISGFCLT